MKNLNSREVEVNMDIFSPEKLFQMWRYSLKYVKFINIYLNANHILKVLLLWCILDQKKLSQMIKAYKV